MFSKLLNNANRSGSTIFSKEFLLNSCCKLFDDPILNSNSHKLAMSLLSKFVSPYLFSSNLSFTISIFFDTTDDAVDYMFSMPLSLIISFLKVSLTIIKVIILMIITLRFILFVRENQSIVGVYNMRQLYP
jgi:hypothetical protein